MVSAKTYTAEDYWNLCQKMEAAGYDHLLEFYNGEIYPRHGANPLPSLAIDFILSEKFDEALTQLPMATPNHGKIISNIQGNLFAFCSDKSYSVYSNAPYVFVEWIQKYYIPDVTVTEDGKERFNEDNQLLNPLIVFEVSSKSTVDKDRSEKFEAYRSVESLQDYLLVSQTKPLVEHYHRLDANRWELTEWRQMEDVVNLSTIGFQINLSNIYSKVSFDEETPVG